MASFTGGAVDEDAVPTTTDARLRPALLPACGAPPPREEVGTGDEDGTLTLTDATLPGTRLFTTPVPRSSGRGEDATDGEPRCRSRRACKRGRPE